MPPLSRQIKHVPRKYVRRDPQMRISIIKRRLIRSLVVLAARAQLRVERVPLRHVEDLLTHENHRPRRIVVK
eukprot:1762651-Prymnesium_polylepis.1